MFGQKGVISHLFVRLFVTQGVETQRHTVKRNRTTLDFVLKYI